VVSIGSPEFMFSTWVSVVSDLMSQTLVSIHTIVLVDENQVITRNLVVVPVEANKIFVMGVDPEVVIS